MRETNYKCEGCGSVFTASEFKRRYPRKRKMVCPSCLSERYHVLTGMHRDGKRLSNWSYYFEKELTIPYGVEEIDAGAFEDCNIEKIILPDTLKSISTSCFSGNSALKKIDIPTSVREIGFGAFQKCTSLEEIILPEGINKVENGTFSGCSKLKRIEIPQSVKEIGSSAFRDCVSLEEIDFPKGIKIINGDTFSGCSKLKRIEIPQSVKEIGSSAFQKCTALEEIILPKGIEIIKNYAFSGCSKLERIDIPQAVKEIGSYAFSDCIALEQVAIPEGVQSIENNAFYKCTSLKNVSIPGSVKIIGDSAFWDTALEEVVLPEGVEEIETNAFYGFSSKLKFVVLPSSLRKIGDYAFGRRFNVIMMPPGVQEIGAGIFQEVMYSWLKYFVTKDSPAEWYLKERGLKYELCNAERGFAVSEEVVNGTQCYSSNNSWQKKVQVAAGVETIGEYAFINHKEIEEISFPDSLKQIRAHAFEGCNELRVLLWKDGIREIGEKAFCDFPGDLVDLPTSIEKLAPDAFPENCIVFIGGEMPLYKEKQADIANQRKVIEGKKADEASLFLVKVSLEGKHSELTKQEPSVSDQIPHYEALAEEVQRKLDDINRAIAQKKEPPDRELAQIDAEIHTLAEARDSAFSAAISEKEAQKEKIDVLEKERERCFFLAISKKKALDAEILALTKKSEEEFSLAASERDAADTVLQSKRDIRIDILKKIHQIDAEATAACAPLIKELKAATAAKQQLLSEYQTAHAAWESKKRRLAVSEEKIEEDRQALIREIESSEKALSAAEQSLNTIHNEWMDKREKILNARKKQDLEREKASIILRIGSPQYQQEIIFSYTRREALAEEDLLNNCYLMQAQYRNEKNHVRANNTFIRSHEKELSRIREINEFLGLQENAGIESFAVLSAPKAVTQKLPERFIKINTYFKETPTWQNFKETAKDLQISNSTKRNIRDRFFTEAEPVCCISGKRAILFFPYCIVLFETDKPMKVLTYDTAQMTVQYTEKETTGAVLSNGELLSERYTHINKDGTPSRRYKENPIIKSVRYTTITVDDGRDKISFPAAAYRHAQQLQDAYTRHAAELSSGTQASVYTKILASEEMNIIEEAMEELAAAEKLREAQEREKAAVEKRRLEEERQAAMVAAEERRKAIIQRQREINEERKRQEQEKAEKTKHVVRLFNDDYEEEPEPNMQQKDSHEKIPVEILGNRLVSNTVFKISLHPLSSPVPDGLTAYFVSTAGDTISNKKKLLQTSSEEKITVGFVLNSGIDYTAMQSCFLRFERQGEPLGEIEFKMNISFYSDF